jgi:predicted metalloprotease
MNRLVRLMLTLMLLMGVAGTLSPGSFAQDTQVGPRSGGDTPTASAGAGEEGVYVSPSYGYSIQYDESWTVATDESQGGYDTLQLDSDGSTFYLEGVPGFDGDIETCLDAQLESFQDAQYVDNFSVIEDENGDPIQAITDESAYALTQATVTTEDGDTGDLAIYLECRPLQEDTAVLVITQIMGLANYESELERKDALVETLDMGGVAQVEPTGTPASAEDAVAHTIELLEAVEPDVDAYWTAVFEQTGLGEYESPTYVNFTEEVDTACGTVEPMDGTPFYCTLDNTVYMDVLFMAEYYIPYGDFVVYRSVAHETGHHVQNLLGIQSCGGVSSCLAGYTTLDTELMADCFAGSWAQNADDRGLIAPGDVESAIVALASFLGDPSSIDMTDPQAHGPGSLRTWWFLRGFYEGPSACVSDGLQQ